MDSVLFFFFPTKGSKVLKRLACKLKFISSHKEKEEIRVLTSRWAAVLDRPAEISRSEIFIATPFNINLYIPF